MSGFEQHRIDEEKRRLGDAAERARRRAREATGSHTPPTTLEDSLGPSDVALIGATLGGMVGWSVGVFALGASLVFLPLGVVGVAALGGAAWARRRRSAGSTFAALESAPTKTQALPRKVRVAMDLALEAIDSSSRIGPERSLEMRALLMASYEELLRAEGQRSALEDAAQAFDGDPSASGRAVREKLETLDARQADFMEQCGRIQASVGKLGLDPSVSPAAIEQLISATSSFEQEARADLEIDELIASARRARKVPGA